MFVVIYSFKIKPEKKAIFEEAWRNLTLLIQEHAGSLGSRLHKQEELHYIAYAQWPDESTWKDANGRIPKIGMDIRKIMQESCLEISTLFELRVVDDLLKR